MIRTIVILLLSISLFSCEKSTPETEPIPIQVDTVPKNYVTSIDSTEFVSYLDTSETIDKIGRFNIDLSPEHEITIKKKSGFNAPQEGYVTVDVENAMVELYFAEGFSGARYLVESPFYESFQTDSFIHNSVQSWIDTACISWHIIEHWLGYNFLQDGTEVEVDSTSIGRAPHGNSADDQILYIPFREENYVDKSYKYGWIKYSSSLKRITIHDIYMTKDFVKLDEYDGIKVP